MEPRKITVFESKNQRKSVFLSSATTLEELKADFRANGIDYTDMAFYEGTTKTELKADNSILPHDVPYKGTITNELVFMLTNVNKKIKSGMDRKELYSEIKKKGLQEECLKRFGKNFTMCKTVDLESVVNEHCETKKEEKEETKKVVTKPSKEVKETKETKETKENKEKSISNIVDAIKELVDILYSYGNIDDEDKDRILNHLNHFNASNYTSKSSEYDSSYSDDEIQAMFSGLV